MHWLSVEATRGFMCSWFFAPRFFWRTSRCRTRTQHRLEEGGPASGRLLLEIQEELREIRDRADQVLRSIGGVTERRARAYWFAQLTMLIDNNHEFLGSASCTIEDTFRELEEGEEE